MNVKNETPAEGQARAGADVGNNNGQTYASAARAAEQVRHSVIPPAARYVVECVKASGACVEFHRYADPADAHAIAARLRSLGCPANVVPR